MDRSIKIITPATSANLGPGFDCLGIALNLYNSFTIFPQNQFEIDYRGYFDQAMLDPDANLVIKSYNSILQKHNWNCVPFKLSADLQIPFEGGLGSSASAIICGVVAAYSLNKMPIDKVAILNDALALEPHPDNIPACLFGGLTTAFTHEGLVQFQKIELARELKFLVIHPQIAVNTEVSRKKIPQSLSLALAVANIGRAATLTAALANKDYSALKLAMTDFLHQPYRLSPALKINELFEASAFKNIYGWALSGSGPSIIAVCSEINIEMERQVSSHFKQINQNYDLYKLQADNRGLVIEAQ